MAEKQVRSLIKETFLEMAEALTSGRMGGRPGIALTGVGGEHGEENAMRAALLASGRGVRVHYIGTLTHPQVACHRAETGEDAHRVMEGLLDSGEAAGAVTMHYPFPIGVATVGRAVAPATGREIFLATTTGTAATDRTESMVRGALAGIITARACGVEDPSVGILNIDGARQTEGILKKLRAAGCPIRFGDSGRAGGGCILRGNDVLTGSCDVIVTDSLTGNVLVKMLSAFTSGGSYETVGYGYGPGIGENYDRLVMIVSRASGAEVVAKALSFAQELILGDWRGKAQAVYQSARQAGLGALLKEAASRKASEEQEEVQMPAKEPVAGEIPGIEVMELEEAVKLLWKAGLYAQSGMGCTGPVVLVPETRLEQAAALLKQGGFIS